MKGVWVIIVETVRSLTSPFIDLLSTSYSIVRHPIGFGSSIDDSLESVRLSLKFLSEAVLLLFVFLTLFLKRFPNSQGLPDVPLLEGIVVLGWVGISLGVCFLSMPFFRLLAQKPLRILAFFTSSVYVVGIFTTLVSLTMLLQSIGLFWIGGLDVNNPNSPLKSAKPALFIGVSLFNLSTIIIGTVICGIAFWGMVSWISRAHEVSRLRVFLTFLLVNVVVQGTVLLIVFTFV